jgi:hypothetical protein
LGHLQTPWLLAPAKLECFDYSQDDTSFFCREGIMWFTEVMQLLGFTKPFVYAAATYGFFHWLDKKASGPAKKAISGWLEPKEYDKTAVPAAIIELFDRVYTHPLWSWRAFVRSALITLLISGVIIFEFLSYEEIVSKVSHPISRPSAVGLIGFTILFNIICDFTSLFLVRWFLLRGKTSLFRSAIVGPGLGMLLVRFFVEVRVFVTFTYMYYLFDAPGSEIDKIIQRATLMANLLQLQDVLNALSIAALAVHLWLPFLGLCAGLVKALNYLLVATNQVRWFLKHGRQHPLDAVGYVAGALVFLGAMILSFGLKEE